MAETQLVCRERPKASSRKNGEAGLFGVLIGMNTGLSPSWPGKLSKTRLAKLNNQSIEPKLGERRDCWDHVNTTRYDLNVWAALG